MITLFSVPKPFSGHIEIIQRNAIESWSRLHPASEIILCGDEFGTAEIAAEFKLKHIPHIARNEYGTPLLDSVFNQVVQIANCSLMGYVNADIILMSDFIKAVHRIHFKRFLMVGQRWNTDIRELLNFEQTDWEARLCRYVADRGVLHPPAGSDYFVFPQDGSIEKILPFAVGRAGWDNWFIFRARQLGIPVIDATRVVAAIHQNHNYNHVPYQRDKTYLGPESDRNLELVRDLGYKDHRFTPLDATHILTSRMLLPALGSKYLYNRWLSLPILAPRTRQIVQFLKRVKYYLQPILSWLMI